VSTIDIMAIAPLGRSEQNPEAGEKRRAFLAKALQTGQNALAYGAVGFVAKTAVLAIAGTVGFSGMAVALGATVTAGLSVGTFKAFQEAREAHKTGQDIPSTAQFYKKILMHGATSLIGGSLGMTLGAPLMHAMTEAMQPLSGHLGQVASDYISPAACAETLPVSGYVVRRSFQGAARKSVGAQVDQYYKQFWGLGIKANRRAAYESMKTLFAESHDKRAAEFVAKWPKFLKLQHHDLAHAPAKVVHSIIPPVERIELIPETMELKPIEPIDTVIAQASCSVTSWNADGSIDMDCTGIPDTKIGQKLDITVPRIILWPGQNR
jgi:hypothetical protein